MGLTREDFEAEFKKCIYDPYNEAWLIMKSIRKKDLTDEDWHEYTNKCYAFRSKYSSEIGGSIFRVMLDAGSEVSRIVKK